MQNFLQIIWHHHQKYRIEQGRDGKEDYKASHDGRNTRGKRAQLQTVKQGLKYVCGFFFAQRHQIHEGRKHGHEISSLWLEVPGIGIDDAKEDGNQAGEHHYGIGEQTVPPVLPGQIQLLSHRKDGGSETDAEDPIVGRININMGRQIHGPEHGYEAAAEQGEKIGAEYHGPDTDAHGLVGGPQERMIFWKAGFHHTGIPCRDAEKIPVVENGVPKKPPAGAEKDDSADEKPLFQEGKQVDMKAFFGKSGPVRQNGASRYSAHESGNEQENDRKHSAVGIIVGKRAQNDSDSEPDADRTPKTVFQAMKH